MASRNILSINPATGETIATYAPMSADEIARRIASAEKVQQAWGKRSIAERAVLMRGLGDGLLARKQELATLAAREMGKILSEGVAEVEKCANACRYYAEHAAAMLADRPVTTESRKAYVSFQPLGVILAIMPWNFPFWQVFRAAVPALMAGNGIVLKHASNTSGCAQTCETLFKEAGFPEGIFTYLQVPGKEVHTVIAHPAIRAVTLTGSTPAGRSVAEVAGKHLKKTVLELGGSDAYVVLDDADIAHAATVLTNGRLLNAGQSCIAAKRLIVTRRNHDNFVTALTREFEKRQVGDPLMEGITMGPMARTDLRDELHRQVQDSLNKGAKAALGGKLPQGPGAFYPPTILTHITPGMPAYDEELFGPAASVIEARDEEDAIRIANDSNFGLGSGIFSRDLERAEALARNVMQSGACFVNAAVRSDARLPFGGVKDSGYGRELSDFGIREFVNIKSISIA